MLNVTIRREGEAPRNVSVEKAEVLLGKHAECDVVLSDPQVSRRHARITVAGDTVLVEDLGSTNGTEVGGREVSARVAVAPGEEIRIGPFSLSVALPAAPAAAAETAAPEERPELEATRTLSRPVEPPPAPQASTAPPRQAPAGLPANVSFGPLDVFFQDESVSEVMVNGPDEIFIERGGRLELTQARFPSEETLRDLVLAIAADVGRSVDERRPMLDARLRDGSRVNAVLPPLALRGTYLTVRRFPKHRLTVDQLLERGAVTQPMVAFLRAAVTGKTSLLISGGTGSGKTTLLSSLCAFIGEGERIITIEDAAELRLPQRHVLPLEAKPPGPDGRGEVTIRDLVRNALRMRPDRIVVGEVRGGEALDMLQAMNTGHEGSLGTIHGNAPREAVARLETLVLFAGTDLPPRAIKEQVVGAIRLVVHTERGRDGKRRVTSITEITGLEGDQVTMGEIFAFDESRGKEGAFVATGYIPRLRDKLAEHGVKVDNAWFQ